METLNILCCINGFKPSEAAIDYGSWLAKNSQDTLKLFHAIDTQYTENEADLSGSIGLGAKEELLAEFVETEHQQNKLLQRRGKIILDAGAARVKRNGVVKIDQCLRKGKLIENIMDLKEKVSIVVLGKYGEKHQHTQNKSGVGHKVESIIRTVEKPILIVSEDFKEPKSMCLAFDGSENSKKALNFIAKNSFFKGLEIHLVYVGTETENLKADLNAAHQTLQTTSISSKVVFLEGDVDESLKDYVQRNDIGLLAMGAFSHSWLRDMVMGSLTSKVISIMSSPVLVVR
jgi:nucleotide-binding universal stress UspA family protein